MAATVRSSAVSRMAGGRGTSSSVAASSLGIRIEERICLCRGVVFVGVHGMMAMQSGGMGGDGGDGDCSVCMCTVMPVMYFAADHGLVCKTTAGGNGRMYAYVIGVCGVLCLQWMRMVDHKLIPSDVVAPLQNKMMRKMRADPVQGDVFGVGQMIVQPRRSVL